jgi:hypothetical protein
MAKMQNFGVISHKFNMNILPKIQIIMTITKKAGYREPACYTQRVILLTTVREVIDSNLSKHPHFSPGYESSMFHQNAGAT